MIQPHLLVFGLGYSGAAVARAALEAGFRVTGTHRDPTRPGPAGVRVIGFDAAGPVLAEATHLLATAGPDEATGDPVLARYGEAVRAHARLHWIGYLSSTGVYGDHGGAWVDEDTPPVPRIPRARRRLAAELAWREEAAGRPLDIFRLAGIYGPGRSVLDDLRAGRARHVVRPGHAFGRIHRDDIACAVLAAMRQDRDPGARVLNLADDEPAESAAVLREAARLLGIDPPPPVPFAEAEKHMSPMAREFWSESRRVGNAATKATLGIAWRHPTYREGLRAILAAEQGAHG